VVLYGLLLLGLQVLAEPAAAAPQRFGPRVGSNFSGGPNPYGRRSKPFRENRDAIANPFATFAVSQDDRLENSLDSSVPSEGSLASSEESNDSKVDYGNFLDFENGVDQFCGDGDNGCSSEPNGCYANPCEPDCGCDDYCGSTCDSSDTSPRWMAGFELSFVKPRFSENVAFTRMEGDGASSSSFNDTEFNDDLEVSPRVWLGLDLGPGWGWRFSYWQFDQTPAGASGSPAENGFGEITHPEFGDVDLSSTIPTDNFTALSNLNAYTLDLEALKQASLNRWQLAVGGGVRFASVEQNYFAQLRNTGNVLRGQIDFDHAIEGFGPTVSLSAQRPLLGGLHLTCAARGALLFGDGRSRLVAGEDLDLANPFTTTRLTNRADLLPIGEARLGLAWMAPKRDRSGWQWLLATAMEGQVWHGAGNATSETADLGFFGFSAGVGVLR